MESTLKEALRKLWSISPTQIERVEKGLSTKTFLLQHQTASIFSNFLSHRGSFDIIDFHRSNSIPALSPIPSNQSNRVETIDIGHLVLYPFINGTQKGSDELAVTELGNLAQLQARIHKLGKERLNFKVSEAKYKLLDYEKFDSEVSLLEAEITSKPNLDNVDSRWLQLIKKKRLQVDRLHNEQPLDLGDLALCHGDFHNENIFFDSAGEVVALIDYEFAQRDFFHGKVVKSLDLLIFEQGFGSDQYSKASFYLQNYRKINAVDRESLSNNIRYSVLKRVLDLWPIKQYYSGVEWMVKHLDTQHNKFDYLTTHYDQHLNALIKHS